jgi:spore coat protein H
MWRLYKTNTSGMNLNLKFYFSGLLLSSLIGSVSDEKVPQLNEIQLNLKDSGKTIENHISFYTSSSNYESIKAITGVKINVHSAKVIINGDTLVGEEISTRGQTTLYLRRKSYSFRLKSAATFRHGEKEESFKRFFVLGLSMDRNYCNNRMAYEMMSAIRVFDLFYTFCELRINDQSEGICMVVERPEDWAIKRKDSPLLIRRGYDHKIDKIKTGKETEKSEIKKYNDYYKQIYRSLNKYEGEELYNVLSRWLDMDAYMKWLAFNFFVRNGDYTDEVYFYLDPVQDKFSIIPWDYDDLFSISPHETRVYSIKVPGDKFLFSTEDLLDKKIASDPVLYERYLVQFGEVLNMLSPEVLKKVFENTYSELYPYFSINEIIEKSKYDTHKDTDLERLKKDMITIYENLIISRNMYLNYLAGRIKKDS